MTVEGNRPPQIYILTTGGIWANSCQTTLETAGFQTQIQKPTPDSVQEGVHTLSTVYIVQIPSTQDWGRTILALKAKEFGARVAEYYGKSLPTKGTFDSIYPGNFRSLRREDPDF